MLVDLGTVLKPEATKTLKKGQILGFNTDGKIQHYKIIRINKTKNHVWAEKVTLYTEDEMKDKWEDVRHA